MNQIKIGEFLKELRRQKNITQQEAAESLFVSQKTISRWETGEGIPDISIIMDVAKFYDVTVDEILQGCRKVDGKTIENKQIVKEENGISKLEKYFFISLGIIFFFLLLGIIFYYTFTWTVLAVVFPISLVIGNMLYIYGYNDVRKTFDATQKTKAKKKNILFSDIICACVIIFLMILIRRVNFLWY